MTHSRPPRPASPTGPLRVVLALGLAAGVIALAAFGIYLLLAGSSPITGFVRPQTDGEPILVVVPATPAPSVAGVATHTPTPVGPPPTATKSRPTPSPTSTQTPPPADVRAIVNAELVNIRRGPGTDFGVVGQIPLGQPFRAVGRTAQNDWLEICCPLPSEQAAWVSAEFMALLGAVDAIPVIALPPTPVISALPPLAQPAGEPATGISVLGKGLPAPGGFAAPGDINPLTGFPLSPERRNRRPLIVCLNNDFAARPQFGTDRADVVYEYLMEGYSITRFSGVYYGDSSEQIGPVRSARLINLSLGALYDAGLACSGASDPVRFALKNDAPFPYLDIDLDDPSNSRYTTSIGSDYRTRLRTSSGGLRRWLADWGMERPPSLRGFTFGDLPAGGAPAATISIPYPQVTGSQVAYRYDAGSGRYLRFLGGQPHLDGNSGVQLALDTVLVQYVPHQPTEIVEDSLGSKSIQINLFGSGKALLFRNGVGFEGTWQSTSRGDMPRFFNSQGEEIPLKPGKSWISVVPLTYAVAYQ